MWNTQWFNFVTRDEEGEDLSTLEEMNLSQTELEEFDLTYNGFPCLLLRPSSPFWRKLVYLLVEKELSLSLLFKSVDVV